jgi:glycosyltransferase involved in cell wall biosynthesis
MTVALSICIPTYNRAGFLAQALASILDQAPEHIEVVITDNASTDETPRIVEEFRSRHPRLVYHRWPENMGMDLNFFKAIEVASGEYCWWLGSDDILEPGAIATVLGALARRPEYIFVNARYYDRNMEKPGDPVLSRLDFTDPDTTLQSMSSWISYISASCFRREAFQKHLHLGMPKVGSLLAFCYVLAAIIKQGANTAIAAPVIRYRGGNSGGYNVYRIFIKEFEDLVDHYGRLGYSSETCERVRASNYLRAVIPSSINLKLNATDFSKGVFWRYVAASRAPFRLRLVLIAIHLVPAFLVRTVKASSPMIRGIKTALRLGHAGS